MNTISLKKYNSENHNFLILDPGKNNISFQPRVLELLSQKNLGIGSDALLYGPIYDNGQILFQIYRKDIFTNLEALNDSFTETSAFAKYLLDEGYVKDNSFILCTKGIKSHIKKNNGSCTITAANKLKSFDEKSTKYLGTITVAENFFS